MRIFSFQQGSAPACVTPLPGTLDGAVDRLAQCDLRAGTPFDAEGGDALTLHCVLEGTMQAEVDGGEPIAIPCMRALLLPAGRAIRLSAERQPRKRSRAPDARVVIGSVSPRAAAALGLAAIGQPLVHDLSQAPGAAPMIAALVGELDSPGLGTIPLLSALMKLCLIHVARDVRTGSERPGGSRVGRAVAAVLTDPGAPHSIGTLAELVRMSRATFIRHFMRLTGSNPMAFVSKARMDHAAELLRSTDLPVKAIAAQIGFRNRSHFSRAFRRIHGIDPSAYRKSLGNGDATDQASTQRVPGKRESGTGHAETSNP